MSRRAAAKSNALFVDFVALLRDYGVPASPRDLLELHEGFEKGVVASLDDLFVFMRLVFVRRVEHMDAFERAFALYFYGVDIPTVAEGDYELFNTKQFRDWLEQQLAEGKLPRRAFWQYDPEELMRRFWDTVREQMEAHHGGSRWVGTGGNSPFGHSGNAEHGVRVYGESRNRSAIKVIGERRYLAYAADSQLREENLRQALESMKHMKNEGPRDLLNLDATIYRTARNGGEIELVLERDLRDKISVVLLIDNGGFSMTPFIELTRLLFTKLHERFEDLTTYFFHNTLYDRIFVDYRRVRSFATEELLLRPPEVRLVIVGDATMAPEELESPGGAIYNYGTFNDPPSTYWLGRLGERFRHTCWLNPIAREHWDTVHGAYTLNRVRDFFHMEDMTLGGIKNMVDHLSEK
jgi:hypothetical protein